MAQVQDDRAAEAAIVGNREVFGADESAQLRRMIGRLARAMNPSASTEDLTPTQASVLGVVVMATPAGREKSNRIRESRIADLLTVVDGLPPATAAALAAALPALAEFTDALSRAAGQNPRA